MKESARTFGAAAFPSSLPGSIGPAPKLKILVVCLNAPYPAYDGTRLYIYHRVANLARASDVHMLLSQRRSSLPDHVLEHLGRIATLHFAGELYRGFRYDDVSWVQTLEFLNRNADEDCSILAPMEFRETRCGVVGYHDTDLKRPDLYTFVVLNRDWVSRLSLSALEYFRRHHQIVYANPVFAVLASGFDRTLICSEAEHAAPFQKALGTLYTSSRTRRFGVLRRMAMNAGRHAGNLFDIRDPMHGLEDQRDEHIASWLRKHGSEYDVVEADDSNLSPPYLRESFDAIRVMHFHSNEVRKLQKVIRRSGSITKAIRAALSIGKYRKLYKEYLNNLDVCVSLTEDDKQYFSSIKSRRPVKVIKCNVGVDLDYHSLSYSQTSPTAACFTGTMNYQPNVEAAVWFSRRVLPRIRGERPYFKFYIVGVRPTEQVLALSREAGIVVTGTVPDTRPYMCSAGISVIPIRMGGGVSTKLLHSLALGIPVVTFADNLGGLPVRHEEEVLIANDANSMARQVLRLLADERLRKHLAVNGRRYVEQHHRWERIIGDYQRHLVGAMESHSA